MMSNDILNPDYSQMLSVFISETEMLVQAWLEQLQPSALATATVPPVEMILMIHRLLCCKINQWVIFWVWDPLVLVGARKSPSAGNPLSSIKGMILLLLNTCEQVDQIFCLHFLHR